jgi:hypothetical protein
VPVAPIKAMLKNQPDPVAAAVTNNECGLHSSRKKNGSLLRYRRKRPVFLFLSVKLIKAKT